MGKCKRHTAIILCCASFLINKPAYAFWPVLDFGEIIPIVSNVTTSLDSLSQTKSQLTELKNSLKAIGDSIDTISQFSQDLRNNLDDIADIANESAGIVNDNLGTNIDIQNGVTDVIDKVNNVQSGLVNNVVEQTQGALDQADGMADKATSGIDTAQKTGKDAENLLNKAQEKTQKPNTDTEKSGSQGISGSSAPVSSQPEAVEEEEEEEEIPDINDMAALREEIKAGFAVARDENKKMAEQLNDVMDASVSALNKTTEESRLALEKLAQAVRDTDRLDKQDKEVLEKKIGELQVRQQRLADRMIAVAESAKEEYNLEYQNKIADGIDNYEKVIERYLRGDASREEVISAGEKLKEDAALLNVAPDKGIIAELNKEAEILKSEFAAMAAEIKKTEKKGKETVN